jgi:hypothetical protein
MSSSTDVSNSPTTSMSPPPPPSTSASDETIPMLDALQQIIAMYDGSITKMAEKSNSILGDSDAKKLLNLAIYTKMYAQVCKNTDPLSMEMKETFSQKIKELSKKLD